MSSVCSNHTDLSLVSIIPSPDRSAYSNLPTPSAQYFFLYVRSIKEEIDKRNKRKLREREREREKERLNWSSVYPLRRVCTLFIFFLLSRAFTRILYMPVFPSPFVRSTLDDRQINRQMDVARSTLTLVPFSHPC